MYSCLMPLEMNVPVHLHLTVNLHLLTNLKSEQINVHVACVLYFPLFRITHEDVSHYVTCPVCFYLCEQNDVS